MGTYLDVATFLLLLLFLSSQEKRNVFLINGIKQLSTTHLPTEVLHSLTQPNKPMLAGTCTILDPRRTTVTKSNGHGLDLHSPSMPVGAVGQDNKEINRFTAGDKRYEMLWQ